MLRRAAKQQIQRPQSRLVQVLRVDRIQRAYCCIQPQTSVYVFDTVKHGISGRTVYFKDRVKTVNPVLSVLSMLKFGVQSVAKVAQDFRRFAGGAETLDECRYPNIKA